VITTQVDTLDGEPPPVAAESIEALVAEVLNDAGTGTAGVQVVFGDDEYLKDLKSRFLGQSVYTDVIAFNLNETDEPLEGEIYISPQRARENSRRYHQSYRRELLRLVVHGCLHLVGYEDDMPEQEAHLRVLEDHYLEGVAPETEG
jgi:rRNA maturation RNase YbeY